MESTERSFIVRADSDVFSVGYYLYGYYGGAHGFQYYGGVSFDAKDGHQIHLSELITDDSLLHQALEQELQYEYPEHEWYWPDVRKRLARHIIHGDSWNNDGLEYEDMRYPYSWVLTPQGVCFYFNEYSIGSYVEGYFKVLLPFDQYRGLYTGRYGKTAGDWVQNIPCGDAVVYAQNGHTVHLNITGYYDYSKDGKNPAKGLSLGYSATAFDSWDTPADAFTESLVFTGGRYYLYVFCESAARSVTYVYDLNGRQPVRIAALQDGNAQVVYDAEIPVARADGKTFYHSGGQTVRCAFSNLQQLTFTRGAGLGAYRVGADGKPVRQEGLLRLRADGREPKGSPKPVKGSARIGSTDWRRKRL